MLSSLLEGGPSKLTQHVRDARCMMIAVENISRCSSLDHLQLVYTSDGVWIPDSTPVLKKRANESLVCSSLKPSGVDTQVPSKKG